jgi:hypothetical protein
VYAGLLQLQGLDGTYPVVISALGNEAIVGRGVIDRFLVVLDHGHQLTIEA